MKQLGRTRVFIYFILTLSLICIVCPAAAIAQPEVLQTNPYNGQIDVPVDSCIDITFDSAVKAGSNISYITLDTNGTVVQYTYTLGSGVMHIVPSKLEYSTEYSLSIPDDSVEGLTDSASNNGYVFSFITQAHSEVVNLRVASDEGAGRFKIYFNAPAQSVKNVVLYEAVMGTDAWSKLDWHKDTWQPNEVVEVGIKSKYPSLDGGKVKFKAVVVDTFGVESAGVVDNNSGEGYKIQAYKLLKAGPKGWTTFSVPVKLDSGQKIFGDIINPNDVDIAYKYNSNQTWVQVLNADSIEPLDAIYVKLKRDTLATINPSTEITSPPVKQLVQGWNLIGPTDTRVSDSLLYSVKNLWNVAVSPSVNPTSSAGVWAVTPGQQTTFTTHYGYWLYMESNGLLTGFSSTPLTPDAYPM